MPFAYLLRCADDSYYAGSTWDLEARLWQHNESPDLGAAYTRRRRPVELVWSAWFDSIEEAYRFEKRIQGWSRRKREALIRGEYEALPDLSRRSAVQRRLAVGTTTRSRLLAHRVSRLGASAPHTSTSVGSQPR